MSDGVTENKSIIMVAGEASGDRHGAKLVKALRRVNQSVSFRGIGGSAMREAGVRIDIDAVKLSVVGITEVFSRLPTIFAALRSMKKLLRTTRPGLLILIDYPEFNLKLAQAAKRLGIPVLYYISPQIWAWRPGRVKRIARCVDHMAVILPFEEDFYRGHRIKATFVGHPLLDDPLESSRPERQSDHRPKDDMVIGLLPGSRAIEIKRHLPVMLEAAAGLQQRHPGLRFRLSQSPNLEQELFDQLFNQSTKPENLSPDSRSVETLLADCDLAVAVSGTVTLQAALCGVPMIVIYRVSTLSYWIGRALIRVPYIGLVNLVAGRQLAPELIQNDVSAARIIHAVEKMMCEPTGLQEKRRQLVELRHRLGSSGASARVADIALSMLK